MSESDTKGSPGVSLDEHVKELTAIMGVFVSATKQKDAKWTDYARAHLAHLPKSAPDSVEIEYVEVMSDDQLIEFMQTKIKEFEALKRWFDNPPDFQISGEKGPKGLVPSF